ncbi:hypothetical protein AB0N06_26805 [Streptomyces sp. NPDC051020]|uniref:hypothetical protein n=1 Tax=Streptomyces sp. NPDC051020 TaxID=3155409 RepID=UPI00343C447B
MLQKLSDGDVEARSVLHAHDEAPQSAPPLDVERALGTASRVAGRGDDDIEGLVLNGERASGRLVAAGTAATVPTRHPSDHPASCPHQQSGQAAVT